MFRALRCVARCPVPPKSAFAARARPHRWAALQETVVLPTVDAEAVVPVGAAGGSSAVSGRDLWKSTLVARDRRTIRRANSVCVVGGALAIQRIWHEYRIRPNVVFVPDTERELPSWCMHPELPSVIVRAPPVEVNRRLLSAERCDGFAAEFPVPEQPPLSVAVGDTEDGTSVALASVVVLHGLRIPSNVGTLIRAAADFGFDGVVLDQCVDVFNEKVLRASDGTALSPKLKLFQLDASGGDGASEDRDGATGAAKGAANTAVLQQIARANRLLPLFAVPSQAAESVFSVAKRFHTANLSATAQGQPHGRLGPMLVLGAEARGLHGFERAWRPDPYQTVSLPLPNAAVDSINVAVAGSILLHHFRPNAEAEVAELLRRHSVQHLTES